VPQIRGKTAAGLPIDVLVSATGAVLVSYDGTGAPFPVSLGNSTGKANKLLTGNLVTTAITADQVILTYTVTSLKTFYLEYLLMMAMLTTFAATATYFGTASLENPSGTKLATLDIAGPQGITAPPIIVQFSEPIPIAMSSVIRIVCTPSAVTSFTWKACFGGYEK